MNGEGPLNPEARNADNLPINHKQKIESIFEKFELISMQHVGEGGMNINSLSEHQKNRLFALVEKNEEHTFDYYREKLKVKKEIKLAEIQAGNFNFKTNRITLVIVSLALFIITIVILLAKDSYFVPWLTFVTGLIGGYGFAKTDPQKKIEKL